ncbi:sensor histidine kinase [Vibrio cholerae]|nr:sensor histidine kinase [Vibrio cholerae]
MKLAMPAALTEAKDVQSPEAPWRGGVFMAVTLIAMTAGLWGRNDYASIPEPGLIIVAAASYLPLFYRRRRPILVLGIVVALEVLHLTLLPLLVNSMQTSSDSIATFQPVPVATMAAIYTVALRREPATAWIAGLAAGAVLFGVAFILYPTNLLATTLVLGNLVIIATAIGTAVRHRRTSRAEREQAHRQHVRREVLAERMRIARELHDVLAHNLTLVNAQAGVAKYLLHTDPGAAEAALGNITVHTRKAIDDLRSTVGLLRDDTSSISDAHNAPDQQPNPSLTGEGMTGQRGHSTLLQPADLAPTHTLEHLPDMLEMFRSAGNAVVSSEDGEPVDLPPLNDLSAYRIIQESLTNAAKHAPRAPITVALRWHEKAVDITVTNASPPPETRERPRPHRPAGTGHGLIGMRERAVTAGGTFTAGLLPDGGFEVHASIPTGHHDNKEHHDDSDPAGGRPGAPSRDVQTAPGRRS